ncbi:hypothetical protein, partial [Paenibacillus jiagnxiensis]|uniref:hypothetical protein n=1 Tax=Paenibacillus jiagnxiensis TaxID=3228926 RepID=UPI0033A2BA1D
LKHIDRNAEGFYISQNYYLVWERGTQASERTGAYLDGNYFLLKKLDELREQGQDLSKLTVAEMDQMSLEAASKLHKASSLMLLASDLSGSRGISSGSRGMSSGFSYRYFSTDGQGGSNPKSAGQLPSKGTGKSVGNESVIKMMSENNAKYRSNLNYDCSEIADDLANASGGKGEILTIRSSDKYGQIEVYEYGSKVEFEYHTVYSDGKYIYDPRYSNEPVLKETYLDRLSKDNGGKIDITNQVLE